MYKHANIYIYHVCRWQNKSYAPLNTIGCLLHGVPLGEHLCYSAVCLLYVHADVKYVQIYIYFSTY